MLSGTADFSAEDFASKRGYGNGRQPIDEEGAGDDHQWYVPEPERQEDLLVNDVLWQDAESAGSINLATRSNVLHSAAYSGEKKIGVKLG